MAPSSGNWTLFGRSSVMAVCTAMKEGLIERSLPSPEECQELVVRPHGTGVLVTHPKYHDRIALRRRGS